MDPEPRPVQRPIPIVVGGHSDAAIDRAARLGDGWITAAMSTDRLAELLEKLSRRPSGALTNWHQHRSFRRRSA